MIEPPDRFGDIMSTQMQILDLPRGVHETSDYVALAIKAAGTHSHVFIQTYIQSPNHSFLSNCGTGKDARSNQEWYDLCSMNV